MSLKSNTIANYCNRLYNILIGIVILPFYLQYLGPAAFGLISLFTMMLSWLSVLDMGLTPTLSREVAYHRNQKTDYFNIKQFLRSLECIFFVISIGIVLTVIFSSHWITYHWLKIENLTCSEVTYCIVIIGMMISLRWFADLYRAGILGMEHQVWLNGASIIITTLQYGGGYVLLRWVTRIPSHFFEYQLSVAVIEPIVLGIKFYKILPTSSSRILNFNISWKLMGKVFPFACGIFYTSVIFTFLAQSDKLILSHIMSLSMYGYFALVTILSGAILQFSAPISQALLPRMTHLLSQGNTQEMLRLYRNVTQITAVIMLPLTGVVALFSTELVYAWTGNRIAANWAGPILFWYALGNGVLSISAFQYYLQFANGNLKLHVIFNTLFAIIVIPLMIFSAYYYGAMGTAITWFSTQIIAFFILPPIIHHKYAPTIHREWLFKDILPILIVAVAVLLYMKTIPIDFELMGRNESFMILGGFTILVSLISALASSTCRNLLVVFIRKRGSIKI
jgi:O-antigen/teichoic acid export membrane protein